MCNEKGVELAIIDSSSCKHLNNAAKEKYWTILNDLLKSIITRL
jgi:hypothetical protein